MLKAFILIHITLAVQITSVLSIICESHEFECKHRYQCIGKIKWCDRNYDCSDQSDEQYCNYDNYNQDRGCVRNGMYECDNGGCIPTEGRCDGFPSCREGSDEYDCGCEEMSNAYENIKYKAYIGRKRYLKCWRIEVPPNKYLNLMFTRLDLKGLSNERGHISIKWKKTLSQEELIDIFPHNQSSVSRVETFDDTEITFRSMSSKRQSNYNDFQEFGFTYTVADILCKRSDVFKCSNYSCIVPEKKCDGIRDCENGLDEHRCERGVFAIEGVNSSRNLGINWLKNQRNAAWGWRENTHRAVIAMYLAQGASFNGTNKEEELTAKQLELQMSTGILRNGTDQITPTQLSMYVNALLVICHDPRKFYGYDLIRELRKQAEATSMFYPLPYLALCNAKELPSVGDIDKLFNVLNNSSEHSFLTDIQAMAIAALSCVADSDKFSYLKENITNVTKRLKELQREDGSFGNIYTTALVIQAMLASGQEDAKDWSLKASIEFIKQKQSKVDGSFGNFLATYLILPVLNGKSLVDIRKINCSENLKMPRDGNPVSDIELKLGNKISVHYSIYIGDQKNQEHPVFLRTPENITVLELMRLAAETDPKYKFEYQKMMGKTYIYEVSGIINDPEDGKFWLLYVGMKNASIEIVNQSPDEIIVQDSETIVMWYRSAKIL